ncbi:MAG TPA: hypothetical protein VIH58_06305, partial [Chthoniobacterales bacterium]
MPQDRAGFEPCRVVGFVPNIADTGFVRKSESIIERVTGHISTMGRSTTAQIRRGYAPFVWCDHGAPRFSPYLL